MDENERDGVVVVKSTIVRCCQRACEQCQLIVRVGQVLSFVSFRYPVVAMPVSQMCVSASDVSVVSSGVK